MSEKSTPSTRFDGFTNAWEQGQASPAVPAVRFKADDGSDFPGWEKKKLGEILQQYKEMASKDGTYPHVSLTKEGVVAKTERYNRDFLVRQQDKQYRVTHKDDICYNPANLKFGVICRNKYGDGIFSPIYITYRVSKGNIPQFVEALVTRENFIGRALRFQEGTVYERMAVSPEDFEKMKVQLPSLPEQKKIASCLSSVDSTITLCQRKLDLLTQAKKALMQQIFSQKLRFKADDGSDFPDWEEKKLGDIAEIVRGASPRPINDPKWFDNNSDVGWLRISDVTDQNGRIHYLQQHISQLGQEKTRVVTEPHLLLSIAATVGKPLINYVKTGVHDGFLIFLHPQFDLEYMYQWLEVFRPQWNKYGQPGTQVNLNSDLVKNQTILLPSDEEQKTIGSFLKRFDSVIDQTRTELERWQEVKKSLLQQMFV